MPRYHFDLQNSRVAPDPEGVELQDDGAAEAAAVRFLGELLCEGDTMFRDAGFLRLTVRDQTGTPLFGFDVRRAPVADLKRRPL